jgi:creatinase/prolidase-like protein
MKRGLISWDKSEIPPAVFEQRVDRVRRVLADRDLSALLVYSELWRSNQARFFSNYMPYFNRALLVIPRDMPATLLCGLSPRVYGWIRSVTTIEDVRSAGNFAKPLFEIAAERKWARIGGLELEQFPYDIYKALHAGPLVLASVESAAVFSPAGDQTEMAMRRKAAALAKQILEEEIPNAIGLTDHQFVGTLERRFRRAGAEDLIVLTTNGHNAPAPPCGVTLEENFSVSIALEYRGHWVRVTLAHGPAQQLRNITASAATSEQLDGSYPYEIGSGRIQASCFQYKHNGKRIFFGDTIL